jgi:hypothetical protein
MRKGHPHPAYHVDFRDPRHRRCGDVVEVGSDVEGFAPATA